MSPLNALEHYQQQGWIRALDLAFARFLTEQVDTLSPEVAALAILASHQLGRGHICLDLAALAEDTEAVVGLPPRQGQDVEPPPGLVFGTLESLREALQTSAVVDWGPEAETGQAPLVLQGDRLYLRRYYQYEGLVAQSLQDKVGQRFDLPDNLPERLGRLFDPLKDEAELAGEMPHWQSLAAALAARGGVTVISGGPGTGKTTTVVRVLALLQELALEQAGPDTRYEDAGLRIRLAAPTGKAAARLSESLSGTLAKIREGRVAEIPGHIGALIPAEVATLHRLLGARPDSRYFRHNARNPLHLDVLVVDEASMVDLEMMAALLAAVPPQARLILLGDKDQLASVEAGAVLGDLCRYAGTARYQADTRGFLFRATGLDLAEYQGPGAEFEQQMVMLKKSHRFGEHSGIGRLARAVNEGNPRAVRDLWQQGLDDIALLSPGSAASADGLVPLRAMVLDGTVAGLGEQGGEAPKGYGHYLARVNAGPAANDGDSLDTWCRQVLDDFGQFQLLCAVKEGEFGVQGLNRQVAQWLRDRGWISATEGWYPGRPVMMGRNDYALGLMNGDIGICLPFPHPKVPGDTVLRVVFPLADGSLKRVLPSRLNAVDTVYAMTVHKSQGSEFVHTAMVLPAMPSPVLTRELVYTGITRARRWFTLVSPNPGLMDQAVRQRTRRASGLAHRLGLT